jgi:hypothetical protein
MVFVVSMSFQLLCLMVEYHIRKKSLKATYFNCFYSRRVRGLLGRKRSRSIKDNMAHTMKEVGNMLAIAIKEGLDNLTKAITETVTSEKRSRINEELSKIIGFNIKEHLKTARLIVC